MLFFAVFVWVTSHAWNGTFSYEDCLARNFEPKACHQSEDMNKLGEKLCSIQGKEFDNKNCK
jgi:hypothetical protein